MNRESIKKEVYHYINENLHNNVYFKLSCKELKYMIEQEQEQEFISSFTDDKSVWDKPFMSKLCKITTIFVLLQYYGLAYDDKVKNRIAINDVDIEEVVTYIESFRNSIWTDAKFLIELEKFENHLYDRSDYLGNKCNDYFFSARELVDLQTYYPCLCGRSESYAEAFLRDSYRNFINCFDACTYENIGPVLTFLWLEIKKNSKSKVEKQEVFKLLNSEEYKKYYLFSLFQLSESAKPGIASAKSVINKMCKQIQKNSTNSMLYLKQNDRDYLNSFGKSNEDEIIKEYLKVLSLKPLLSINEFKSKEGNFIRFEKIYKTFQKNKSKAKTNSSFILHYINQFTSWVDYWMYIHGMPIRGIDIRGFQSKMWLKDFKAHDLIDSRTGVWDDALLNTVYRLFPNSNYIDPVLIWNNILDLSIRIIKSEVDNNSINNIASNPYETLFREFIDMKDFNAESMLEFFLKLSLNEVY